MDVDQPDVDNLELRGTPPIVSTYQLASFQTAHQQLLGQDANPTGEEPSVKLFTLSHVSTTQLSIQDQSDEELDASQVQRARRMLRAAKKGRQAIANELTREERREMKEERAQRLTAVTRPLDVQDREFFLGYALIDVVNPHDGGTGPQLLPSPYRRPFSNKQLRNLRASAGKDGRGLRTTDHEHAIVIAAPAECLDDATLSPNPYGPHTRVHWHPNALEDNMVLLAGAHQQKTSQDITAEHAKEIIKLGAQADKAKSKGNTRKAAQVEEVIEKMKKAMEPKVVWLAMIYDRDGILENRRQSGPALLKLITNNRVPPQPETEEHELSRVFRLAYEGGVPNTSRILQYISTLNSTRNDAYRRLEQRGGDFLAFVIGTRLSTLFDNFFTDSAKIVNVQSELWGLISPVLTFMWNQLLYVCSTLPVVECEGPITDDVCTRLVNLISQSSSQRYISRPVLDTVLTLADASFNEHFGGEFTRIGIEDEAYYQSYCDYAEDIMSSIREALRQAQVNDPARWKAQDTAVALHAPTKLRLLLMKHAVLHAPGAPIIDNPTPIFSPMSAAAIIDDWSGCANGIFMVSSWFMPGLTHFHTVITTGAVDKSPITSYPAVIRLFLEYWLGFDIDDDWRKSTPADIADNLFDDGDEDGDPELGKDILETVFSVLVQLLWRHRETIIRPSQQLLPTIPRGKNLPTRTKSEVDLLQHVINTAPQVLKQWLKALAHSTSIQEKNILPRLDPNLPDIVVQQIQKYQNESGETRLLNIYRTLESSIVNFLVSSTGPSNNSKFYVHYMRSIAEEVVYYTNEFIPTSSVVTPIAGLYQELVHAVQSFPAFEHARFWLPQVPNPPNAPKLIEPGQYMDLIVRNDRNVKVKNFNAALLAFVKRIGRPDCLGVSTVPPENTLGDESSVVVDYKLHRGVRDALYHIHQQAQVVAHHLSVLDHCADPARRPVVEEEWEHHEPGRDETKAPSFEAALCSIDDLIAHYQDQETRQAREIGNEEIDEEALDPDFGRIPRPDRGEEEVARKRRRVE
ncbi:hypothetical protein MD484_g5013, partial [Candolleomyces efflorescens]